VRRVAWAEVLNEAARIPAGFDLAGAWAESRAHWTGRHEPVAARLRIRAGAIADLHPSLRPADWDGTAAPDAWTEIEPVFGDRSHAESTCWALAPDVEVLAPAWLRATLSARADHVRATYHPAG